MATFAGHALAAAGLGYLLLFAARNWAAIEAAGLGALHWPWLAFAFAAYGASLVTTSLAWPAALRALDTALPLRLALGIGLVAQSGKYLPGNVAHYFGRAALAARHGVALRTTGASTLIEFGGAILAACLVIAASIAVQPDLGAAFAAIFPPPWTGALLLLGAVAAAALAAAAMPQFVKRLAAPLRPRRLLAPLGLLVLSFLLAGLSFFAVLSAADAAEEVPLAAAVAVYAAAWVAGFVVPGAPAGIGIREAVLIGVLGAAAGPAAALACAILHRLVTAVADGVLALAGAALLWRRETCHA